MLTVETKINGRLINTIYAHNTGVTDPDTDLTEYYYDFWAPTEPLITGTVHHNYNDLISILTSIIIKDVEKQKKACKE